MKFLKKIIQKINNYCSYQKNVASSDYFTTAKSWADEFYAGAILSRNKWRALSLFVLLPVTFLLLLCVTFLVPSQHLVPLLINHYSDGQTVVVPFTQSYAPDNRAQTEEDIANYIHHRESYSADTYEYTYRMIHLMSDKSVYGDYQALQNTSNKNSPINVMGNKGHQTVKIESIVFLDNDTLNEKQNKSVSQKRHLSAATMHNNLAQVNFSVTTFNNQTNSGVTKPYSALIGWQYKGIPENPSDRWMDWNGFTVTHYEATERNI